MTFANAAAEFVYYRTYARWVPELGRREAWPETVARVLKFLREERGHIVPEKVFRKIEKRMLELGVLPSMRLVWAAGPAALASNVALYNCAFLPVDCVEAFSECLYILTCGTGVGFSVERKYVEKLPVVPPIDITYVPRTCIIGDSKEAWADSLSILMRGLYEGKDTIMDYSGIRPQGAVLRTMGGRASGPGPLMILHSFIRDTFAVAQGRKLTTLEVNDIMNKIAEIVVVGGVRRSSQISLSNLDDEELRNAKNWPFPAHRFLSNNSAVYYEKPTATEFLKEWANLAASGTGERGISNLGTAQRNAPKRRKGELIQGFNPCHEIALRSNEFCNLSTVVIRPDDDVDSLLDKVETATWIGAIQATFMDFPYLRSIWRENCREEQLLGVSLSGQFDNPALLTPDVLRAMKEKAIKVARKASAALYCNMPAAITTVKPEGTSSQITFSGSGAHPWYAPYYIRRYRISSNDPLYKMMLSQGFHFSPENGQTAENASTWVVSFPCKAPDTAMFRNQVGAIQQLEWYKKLQENYCEHNASITVYVKEDEWFEVGNWVYRNWDICVGVSFLPYDGGHYQQAPYEEISKEQYEEMLSTFPTIDYSQLHLFESIDTTEGGQTYACVGDKCELK